MEDYTQHEISLWKWVCWILMSVGAVTAFRSSSQMSRRGNLNRRKDGVVRFCTCHCCSTVINSSPSSFL
jgi:hypothetical protein